MPGSQRLLCFYLPYVNARLLSKLARVLFRAPARRQVCVQRSGRPAVFVAILNLALRSKFWPRTLPIYTQPHPRAFDERARVLRILLRSTSSFKNVRGYKHISSKHLLPMIQQLIQTWFHTLSAISYDVT